MNHLISFIIACVSVVVKAFTFQLIWGWLICKIFPTVPGLTFLQSIVITFVISFGALHIDKSKLKVEKLDTEEEVFQQNMVHGVVVIFSCVLAIAIAAIYKALL